MLTQVFLSVLLLSAFTSSLPPAQFRRNPNIRAGRLTYGPCKTPNGKPGTCILLQQCKKLYSLVMTQQPLHDVNRIYLTQSQCGYLYGKVLICCPNQNPIPSTTAMPSLTKPTQSRLGLKKSILIDKTSMEKTKTKKLPRSGQCGQMSSGRIYGGNVTEIDEFPWLALIGYKKRFGQLGYHCGGSLINSRYVITASHCVNGRALPIDWKISTVRLGEWDTNTNPDCQVDARGVKNCAPTHIDVPIEKAIPHPKFDPRSTNQVNDIALLRLKQTITFTDFIQPICLPLSTNLRNAAFDDIIMDVAGWGKTEAKSRSNVKLKAEVTGVLLESCRKVYQQQNIVLESSQLCAGGKSGVDSCRGDSGGPLIGLGTTGRGNSHYFLIGIVSFGPASCGTDGWPGVYTRVGHFVEWIQAVTET
ncbi:unnamed protein product [Ceratitis capitata]|uniref:CLIP domain-containing serine protease n=2 Tax=Ceratitis capitata TaxID=7213 RepID=A0A811U114_CERCA|nr:unnamed protein product [Ceratitis capitata]